MSILVHDYCVDISDDGMNATCHFPGVSYDDYDRKGCISPWKICRMFEAGRVISLHHGNYLNFNDLVDKNCAFFVLGGNYYFDSCLWEVPHKHQYFPYKVCSNLIDIGQTSLTLRQTLLNTLDNKEIATFYVKLVYVDRSSKRPAVLPYWHRIKYRTAESNEKVRVHTAVHSVPDNAFKGEAIIGASDTDFNRHTNQASYIRFCLDTAASGTQNEYFKRLTKDICMYPILKMSVAYHSETISGDHITTSVWEDDLSPHTLSFSTARGKDVVFTSTMTFKEKMSSKL